jgi:hypothetical protein
MTFLLEVLAMIGIGELAHRIHESQKKWPLLLHVLWWFPLTPLALLVWLLALPARDHFSLSSTSEGRFFKRGHR